MACLAILGMVVAVPSLGQVSQSESQTLQQILVEIKAIHEEMRVTETTQILLTELEIQQGVVNRAMQRVDEARAKLQETQAGKMHMASELARAEDQLNQTADAAREKEISESIEGLKGTTAVLKAHEQDRTTSLQGAQDQLRNAQEALDGIQSELNSIVKGLRPVHN